MSEQGKQQAWEPVGHSTLTDWKKYSGILELKLYNFKSLKIPATINISLINEWYLFASASFKCVELFKNNVKKELYGLCFVRRCFCLR